MIRRGAIFGSLFAIGCFLGGTEIGLRVFPELIPRNALLHFQHDTRTEIAARLGLWNAGQVVEVVRDDGGPPLTVFRPNSLISTGLRDTEQPGPTQLDGLGFCGTGSSTVPDQVDIVAIGDSFTFCGLVPPDRTWAARLGALSGKLVYNLGRGGVGPYEYLQILRKFGLGLHPKTVVMGIYEGNDLRDLLRYHIYADAVAKGETPSPDPLSRAEPVDHANLDNWVGRHSYVANLLLGGAAALIQSATRKKDAATGGGKVNFHYTLALPSGDVPFNTENSDKDEVRAARSLQAGGIDLGAFAPPLARFAEMGRENNFRPVIAYFPSAYTAYADFVRFDDPALADLMPWYSGQVRAYLSAQARRLGVPFIDMTPGLQAKARATQDGSLLYFPVNVHFTSAGNATVADLLNAAAELK